MDAGARKAVSTTPEDVKSVMNRKDRRAARSLGIDLGDTNVRYGGRTLQVTVVINTDEEEGAVLERVRLAARGPRQAMCIASIGVFPPDEAKRIWDEARPIFIDEARRGGVS